MESPQQRGGINLQCNNSTITNIGNNITDVTLNSIDVPHLTILLVSRRHLVTAATAVTVATPHFRQSWSPCTTEVSKKVTATCKWSLSQQGMTVKELRWQDRYKSVYRNYQH